MLTYRSERDWPLLKCTLSTYSRTFLFSIPVASCQTAISEILEEWKVFYLRTKNKKRGRGRELFVQFLERLLWRIDLFGIIPEETTTTNGQHNKGVDFSSKTEEASFSTSQGLLAPFSFQPRFISRTLSFQQRTLPQAHFPLSRNFLSSNGGPACIKEINLFHF